MPAIIACLVFIISLFLPAAAVASDYPHAGEVPGYHDTSARIGQRAHRPRVFMVGDSITAGFRYRLPPAWEVSAVPGRNVGNLPHYVADRAVARPRLRTLVIALGTNATPGWTYQHYRWVTNMVSPRTKIVFVTPYRDPIRFGQTDYRTNATQSATYARWMVHIAAIRPRTCIADWRGFATRYPQAVHDGVHPTPAGGLAWARIIRGAVSICR